MGEHKENGGRKSMIVSAILTGLHVLQRIPVLDGWGSASTTRHGPYGRLALRSARRVRQKTWKNRLNSSSQTVPESQSSFTWLMELRRSTLGKAIRQAD